MNAGMTGGGGGDATAGGSSRGRMKRRSPRGGIGGFGGGTDDLVSPLFYEPSPLFHPCDCDEHDEPPSHEYEDGSPLSEHGRRRGSGVFAELSSAEEDVDPSARPMRWRQRVLLVVLTLCIASVLIVSSSGQSLNGVVVSVHRHDAFEENAAAMMGTMTSSAAMATTRTKAAAEAMGTLMVGDGARGLIPPEEDEEEPGEPPRQSTPPQPRLVDLSGGHLHPTPYYRPGRAVPHNVRAAKVRTSADYREDRRRDDMLPSPPPPRRGGKARTKRGGGGGGGGGDAAWKCVPRSWQRWNHPTCSVVHEVGHLGYPGGALLGGEEWGGGDGRGPSRGRSYHHANLIGVGTYRYTWSVSSSRQMDARSPFALKTLRFGKEFTESVNDRHRRDALISERLTSSPHVVDTYGYCGGTALFEFASGGTLADAIRFRRTGRGTSSGGKKWTGLDRLRIAADVAAGVADLHGIDDRRGGGVTRREDGLEHPSPSSSSASVTTASVAHADVKASQFVRVAGTYKLNDFNMAQFLGLPVAGDGGNGNGTTTAASCKFLLKHKSKTRAPEERRREPQDEKVDVYNLGNVLYELVAGEKPRFGHNGDPPPLPPSVRRGAHPDADAADSAIVAASDMCHVAESTERPSAREVADFLSGELRRLGSPKRG